MVAIQEGQSFEVVARELGASGEVGPWADLARAQHRAAELGQRDRAAERDTGHEL